MPRVRLTRIVLALALLIGAAGRSAHAGATPVDYGTTELGKIVSVCYSACFGNNCSGVGTIQSIHVDPPYFVRGIRLSQVGSGSVCDPGNSITNADLTLPRAVGADQALVFDIDLVPTSTGAADRQVEINGVPAFDLFGDVDPVFGCTPDATATCLKDDRFKLRVFWRSFQGARGSGSVAPATSNDSGIFYFFSPDNWEMLAKVVDGCSFNNRFWVFAAATTNVEYTLTVTDTEHQVVGTYHNLLGSTPVSVTDTAAFATCP